METIREAPLGQTIRFLTGNRFFKYPEEQPGWQFPYENIVDETKQGDSAREKSGATSESDEAAAAAAATRETGMTAEPNGGKHADLKTREAGLADSTTTSSNRNEADLEKSTSKKEAEAAEANKLRPVVSRQRSETVAGTSERYRLEQELNLMRTQSLAIQTTKTADGRTLVTWYTTDDAADPQNWSRGKKIWVSGLLWVYTFIVYASSSIYTSAQLGVMETFGVEYFKGSLGLALFVLGYGIGPMIFSPLSEVPLLGRNIPYISTFAIFVILAVPTALVKNLGGLLVLRFLQGFFGSPCLATGGATMQDIYSMLYVPVALCAWVSAAFSAPALGPLLSGFSVMAKGWRWALWEILWGSAPIFVVWFIAMPETSADNILLRRAKRIRKVTGSSEFVSQSELNQAGMRFSQVAWDALIKPLEITIKDPAIGFSSLYSGIIYGIYYSFFESFPIVYNEIYGFNLGETGLVFTCIVVGLGLALVVYICLILYVAIPNIQKNGMGPQEDTLTPALIFVFGSTIALFWFGWTSRPNIHWIVPTIGLTIYPFSVFIVVQCIFAYISVSYPKYAASLFAGNDLFRSLFGFGFVMFGRALFKHEGLGKGSSILGGLSVLGWIGIYILYFYGPNLRARSKFAVSPDVK